MTYREIPPEVYTLLNEAKETGFNAVLADVNVLVDNGQAVVVRSSINLNAAFDGRRVRPTPSYSFTGDFYEHGAIVTMTILLNGVTIGEIFFDPFHADSFADLCSFASMTAPSIYIVNEANDVIRHVFSSAPRTNKTLLALAAKSMKWRLHCISLDFSKCIDAHKQAGIYEPIHD